MTTITNPDNKDDLLQHDDNLPAAGVNASEQDTNSSGDAGSLNEAEDR